MTLRTLTFAWLFTAVAFLLIDALWLWWMGERLYRPAIGHLMQSGFSLMPAALFYLVYVSGIVHFAVTPALERGDWEHALRQGAILGFVAYATYDLTNQATLRDWPWTVTAADLVWGSFVTGTAAAIGCRAVQALMPAR